MNGCFGCNTCASADKPLEGFIRNLPMETSHHRVEGQSTKCGFGLQGVCCRLCSNGPCRITPKAPRGICGATADVIVARNFLRAVASGSGCYIHIVENTALNVKKTAMEKGEIKGIYTPEEFRQLSEQERERMGLRAVDLRAVFPPKPHSIAPIPVLELRNVTLRYKKRTILHDIGLSAGKGEVIGVVGHNGAGKTTFSRALCGLHKDCDGQFLWESKPIERKERLQRSYMVMQDVNYELFADSVEAECSFGIRNPDQTLVNATLEELGLSPYREQHPNTLSGGQKQRVAVAVSMICGKDLLVFDEPTSGLDFDSMTQVAGLIRRLSNMGKVIFIVTHDFEFVCRTCSRVLHFDEGEMPDDVPVTMDALPKLRELFSVSDGKER